jgi:hypothetical protein
MKDQPLASPAVATIASIVAHDAKPSVPSGRTALRRSLNGTRGIQRRTGCDERYGTPWVVPRAVILGGPRGTTRQRAIVLPPWAASRGRAYAVVAGTATSLGGREQASTGLCNDRSVA